MKRDDWTSIGHPRPLFWAAHARDQILGILQIWRSSVRTNRFEIPFFGVFDVYQIRMANKIYQRCISCFSMSNTCQQSSTRDHSDFHFLCSFLPVISTGNAGWWSSARTTIVHNIFMLFHVHECSWYMCLRTYKTWFACEILCNFTMRQWVIWINMCIIYIYMYIHTHSCLYVIISKQCQWLSSGRLWSA